LFLNILIHLQQPSSHHHLEENEQAVKRLLFVRTLLSLSFAFSLPALGCVEAGPDDPIAVGQLCLPIML